MSKNTRWALAIVGVAVIIVAAVVIGTGKDDTDATPTKSHEGTHSGQTAPTGPSGTTGGGSTAGGSGHSEGDHGGSGGASPGESGGDSGGASPHEESGGAKAQIGVVSPVLTAAKPQTVTAKKGEMVTIRAKSTKAATLHVHGYDAMVELKPGAVGQVRFKATIDGEFEIELHYAGTADEAGKLRVSP